MTRFILLMLTMVLITGCVGEDSEESPETLTPIVSDNTGDSAEDDAEDGDQLSTIFIAQLVAADYSSSEIALGYIEGDEIVEGYATQTASDYSIDVYGQYLYHIGKFNIDTLTRYDSEADFLQSDYTYNLAEPESSSTNTYKLVQVAENKAYLIRYGKASVQIIDPTADEDAFITGEIDLSAYNPSGRDVPSMSSAVLADGKLFVGMQRLDSGWQPTQSYVAVIDTDTDTEIDTSAEEGLKGIALNTDNLSGLTNDDDYVYASGRGNYGDNSGALQRINIADYSVETLVDGTTFSSLNDVSDDGDASNDVYYHITGTAIVDDTGFVKLNREQGYSSLNSLIYSFDTADTSVFTAVTPDALNNKKISLMTAGPDDTLWLGIDSAEEPAVYILNEAGEVQGEALEFTMPVSEIEFMEISN